MRPGGHLGDVEQKRQAEVPPGDGREVLEERFSRANEAGHCSGLSRDPPLTDVVRFLGVEESKEEGHA